MIHTAPPKEIKARPSRKAAREAKAKPIIAPIFRVIQAGARRLNRAAKKKAKSARSSPAYFQRCAVRVSYSQNRSAGQWFAHGKYLERDSAQGIQSTEPGPHGFNSTEQNLPVSALLDQWQHEGDDRLWKLIISPENSCDLVRLTRKTLAGMEKELGTSLEWIAVVHRNTDYHHVHVALRGNNNLELPREFVKSGIRRIAENEVTKQIGYRTREQVFNARLREVHYRRFTGLDRMIVKFASPSPHMTLDLATQKGPFASLLNDRLNVLQSWGLATSNGTTTWTVQPDFENVLRAMARTADKMRILRDHGAVVSDPKIPFSVDHKWRELEGRVLVHGEQDNGKPYLILEGTDAKLHYILTGATDLQIARASGLMKPNSFVRLKRRGQAYDIHDLGNATRLLGNEAYFQEAAARILRHGQVPTLSPVAGWLGEYQNRIAAAAIRSQPR